MKSNTALQMTKKSGVWIGINCSNGTLKTILKAITAASVMTLGACADTMSINDANRLFFEAQSRNDFVSAVRFAAIAAEQGDSLGQNNLGYMYGSGKGVSQNDREAAKWYGKAADQGQAEAQHNLGYMYYSGKGVPQDDREAAKWYKKQRTRGMQMHKTLSG